MSRANTTSKSSVGKISFVRKIFITHLHGDHILGLPGLLLGLNSIVRTRDNAVAATKIRQIKYERQEQQQQQNPDLEIYGPPGIYNYIVTNMTHTLSHISLIRIIVYELVDGVEDKAEQLALRRSNSNHSTDRKDPFRSQYHEMEFRTKRNIVRRVIYRNNDHFWNLFEPSPKEVHPGNEKHHSKAGNKNNNNHDNNLLQIQSGEVGHVRGIQTFGYIITELDPPLNIDKDKAIALGVNPGKKYRLLKEGILVEVDDEHTTENGEEKATAAYPDIDIIHEKRNDN
mmetsp:Transcript_60598/g.70900  ORF Transcript_60598/g.70900 Transcript_60598/m.70900 type:complete len:285 (+) Transcript_60598:171-1025(+)